eukprot:4716344-Prymnesium_polylepis.1
MTAARRVALPDGGARGMCLTEEPAAGCQVPGTWPTTMIFHEMSILPIRLLTAGSKYPHHRLYEQKN